MQRGTFRVGNGSVLDLRLQQSSVGPTGTWRSQSTLSGAVLVLQGAHPRDGWVIEIYLRQ